MPVLPCLKVIAHCELNPKQALALYFMVVDHAAKFADPSLPGRMHAILGGPGTGKSYVDDAFQKFLLENNVSHTHSGNAYTGSAASHQGYQTMHKSFAIPWGPGSEGALERDMGSGASDETKRLQRVYQHCVSVSTDEVSLVSASLLAETSDRGEWEDVRRLSLEPLP